MSRFLLKPGTPSMSQSHQASSPLLCAAVLSLASSALGLAEAQEAIPVRVLDDLKKATTFVYVKGDTWATSGSGFLIERKGSVGHVVTNAHVVAPGGKQAEHIVLVFNSGADQERAVLSELVARDDERDLAVLKVKTNGLPRPVSLTSSAVLRETLTVYIIGFPFGAALSVDKGAPAVTIGKGTISSIRKSRAGELVSIQIDGDLNPGNSGGPIVDSKGALIGVALAKIEGTQIGMAIPTGQLEELMLGGVGRIGAQVLERKRGQVKLQVQVELIDPMGKLKGVTLLSSPKDKLHKEPAPDRDGEWTPAARVMSQHRLKAEGLFATGEILLKSRADGEQAYVFQLKYLRGDHKTKYTKPSEVMVDFSEGE